MREIPPTRYSAQWRVLSGGTGQARPDSPIGLRAGYIETLAGALAIAAGEVERASHPGVQGNAPDDQTGRGNCAYGQADGRQKI